MCHHIRGAGDGFYILWEFKRVTVAVVLAGALGGYVGMTYARPAHLHVSFIAFQVVVSLTLTTPVVQSFLYASQKVKEVHLIDRELSKIKKSDASHNRPQSSRTLNRMLSQSRSIFRSRVQTFETDDPRPTSLSLSMEHHVPHSQGYSPPSMLLRAHSQPIVFEKCSSIDKRPQKFSKRTRLSVSLGHAHLPSCLPSPTAGYPCCSRRSVRPKSLERPQVQSHTTSPPHERTCSHSHSRSLEQVSTHCPISPSLTLTYTLPLAPRTMPLCPRTPSHDFRRSLSHSMLRPQRSAQSSSSSITRSVCGSDATGPRSSEPCEPSLVDEQPPSHLRKIQKLDTFRFDLESVLAHPKLSAKFLKFLTLEFAVENLQFLRVVDKFGSLTSPADVNRRALEIYFTFVANNSNCQVCLSFLSSYTLFCRAYIRCRALCDMERLFSQSVRGRS